MKRMGRWMLGAWSFAVRWLSLEPVLDWRPNGGDIILLRAILIAAWVYALALALYTSPLLCPDRGWFPSWQAFQEQLPQTFHWFVAVFAGVYVALYARFSSQWLYLANLYNQIKNTEAQIAREKNDRYLREVMAAWKAGFIEDAEELHLAQKGIFVAAVKAWGNDNKVREHFIANTCGGQKRLETLMDNVNKSYERHQKRHEQRSIAK